MVTGEAVGDVVNWGDVLSALPPEFSQSVLGFMTILKAVGIAFVVYVVYLIVNFVLNVKRYKKLGVVERKIDSLGKKMDRVLKKRR